MNYMNKKNEDLYALMEKYELDKEDYLADSGSLNRKKLNNILKLIDAQTGKAEGVTAIKDDGEVIDHKPEQSNGKLHKSLSGMMVELTFYNSDENDLPYVQLALNGIALIIPRERRVWIPKEFIDGVLQNAIMTKMKMDVDGQGKIRYIPKAVPRFQHTVHDIKHIDVIRKEYDDEKANK
jgi:hypothetical protein